jgi:hypothetical protein
LDDDDDDDDNNNNIIIIIIIVTNVSIIMHRCHHLSPNNTAVFSVLQKAYHKNRNKKKAEVPAGICRSSFFCSLTPVNTEPHAVFNFFACCDNPISWGLPIGAFPERSAEIAVRVISTSDSSWEVPGDRSWVRGPSILARSSVCMCVSLTHFTGKGGGSCPPYILIPNKDSIQNHNRECFIMCRTILTNLRQS